MSRESGSTSSWRLSTLGEIALHDGLQTGPFGSQLHASDYSSKGIPVVMPRDMVGFRISTTTINRTSEETANKLARHLLKAGDIIFARRGEIGRCALVSSDEDGWLCGTGSLRVRLRQDEVLPEFLIQYLNLPHAITWLTSNAVGQTMLNLSTSILSELPINVPPLLEQRKIADILGTWDTAIGTLERLITVLQKRKRGLMQRALTGQVRFPEYQGCQWKEVRLGDVFTERRETGRIDLPLLSITSKQGVIPRDSVERRDTSSEDKSKYLRICKGDLGYNTMRMWQGVSAVSPLEGLVSPAYTICTPRETIDISFMSYLLKFPPTIHLLWRYSQGLVDDTLSLKFAAFSRVKVTIPHLAEQRRISTVLRLCDSEIGMLERQLTALKRQKQGLMQRLLTGQVRVRVDEE